MRNLMLMLMVVSTCTSSRLKSGARQLMERTNMNQRWQMQGVSEHRECRPGSKSSEPTKQGRDSYVLLKRSRRDGEDEFDGVKSPMR